MWSNKTTGNTTTVIPTCYQEIYNASYSYCPNVGAVLCANPISTIIIKGDCCGEVWDSVYCIGADGYLDFKLKNLSNFVSTGFTLHNTTTGAIVANNLSATIPIGAQSNLTTLTLNSLSLPVGSNVCLYAKLFNGTDTCNTDIICITIPDCTNCCGAWESVSYNDVLSPISSSGSNLIKIDCGDTLGSFYDSIKFVYKCKDFCNTKYNYNWTNSNGAIVKAGSYTGSTFIEQTRFIYTLGMPEGYYKLNVQVECGDSICDSCFIFINHKLNKIDTGCCGDWQGIIYYDTLAQSGTVVIDSLICGDTLNINCDNFDAISLHYKCNTSGFLQGQERRCDSIPNLIESYLIAPNGTSAAFYTTSQITNLPLVMTGIYTLTTIIKCDTATCDSCFLFINVNCGTQPPSCCGGTWNPSQFKNYTTSTLQSGLLCNDTVMVNCGDSISFTSYYKCDTLCNQLPTVIKLYDNNNNFVTNLCNGCSSYTFPILATGNWKIKSFGFCNDSTIACDSCTLNVIVNCNPSCCGYWKKIRLESPSTSFIKDSIKCGDTVQNVPCGKALQFANSYACNNSCITYFQTTIYDENNIVVASGNIFNVPLHPTGIWRAETKVYCGANLCSICDIYLNFNCCQITADIGLDTVYLCSPIGKIPISVSTNNPAANILWSNGSTNNTIWVTSTGMYTVSVTDPLDPTCSAIDSVLVLPCCNNFNINVTSSAIALCPNDSVLLTIAYPAGASITWTQGNTTTVNGSNNTKFIITAPGTYCAEAVDAWSCTASTCITILDTCVACNDTCDWHLNGNMNVKPSNYIGSINNADLNIKTNSTLRAVFTKEGNYNFGNNALANSMISSINGSSNNLNASQHSFVYGSANDMDNSKSSAIQGGNSTVKNAAYAIALGKGHLVDSSDAVGTIGEDNTILNGHGTFLAGGHIQSKGIYNIGLGSFSQLSGSQNTSLGNQNQITNSMFSNILGDNNIISSGNKTNIIGSNISNNLSSSIKLGFNQNRSMTITERGVSIQIDPTNPSYAPKYNLEVDASPIGSLPTVGSNIQFQNVPLTTDCFDELVVSPSGEVFKKSCGSNTINHSLNNLAPNTLELNINGIISSAPIINSHNISISGSNLISEVNGMTSTAVLPTSPTTNLLTYTGPNTISSNVNGVVATTNPVGAVTNTSLVNNLTTTVNGVTSTSVPIVNSNVLSLNSANNLVSTVNGVPSAALNLSAIIPATTHLLTNTAPNTITSQVNGIVRTAPIVNTVTNALSGSNLTTTVNGIAAPTINLGSIVPVTTHTIINTAPNTLISQVNGITRSAAIVTNVTNTLTGSNLTTTVNGVPATTINLSSIVPATIHSLTNTVPNTLTSNVNGVTRSVPIINTVANSSTGNNLNTVVNGVSGSNVSLVKTVSNSLIGTNLTTTVNGVPALPINLSPIIPPIVHNLTNSGNTLNSIINSVSKSAVIINSNQITATPNAITGAISLNTNINGINSNTVDVGNAINKCATINSVPRLTGTNTFGCSQINDNGIAVKIGSTFSSGTTMLTFSPSGTWNPPASAASIKLDVGGVLRCGGLIATSDRNLKTNIKQINNASSIIRKLQGKTYNWTSEYQRETNVDATTHLGFIAQEVENVLPEAVSKDEKGRYAVEYLSFIPLLVESQKEMINEVEKLKEAAQPIGNDKINNLIKENINLKKEIDVMKEKFALLEQSIATLCENGCAGLKTSNTESNKDKNLLFQSIPNPTSNEVLINYFLIKTYKEAKIVFYAPDGKMIQVNLIDAKSGNGSLKLNVRDFAEGNYYYTLIVDDAKVDTKKMQVIK